MKIMSMALKRLCLPNSKYFQKSYKRCLSSASSSVIQTESNILASGLSDVVVPEQTLQEFIYTKTESFSKYIATECAITGRKYTFGDIRLKSRNLSKALIKRLKLNDGDVVAVFSNNVPEFPIAVFGILEAGLVCTTLNYLYTEDEVYKQLSDSNAKAVITISNLEATLEKVNNRLGKRLPIITIKTEASQSISRDSVNFAELCENNIDIPDFAPTNSDNVAFIPYSSGTTGLPKGVLLTHQNLVSNLIQAGHPDVDMFDGPPTDEHQNTVPCIIPMFHIYGFNVNTMMSLASGVRVLTLPKFVPDTLITTLKNYDVNYIFAAPPLVIFLNTYNDIKPEHLRALKLINSGAAPLSESDEQHFNEKFGQHILTMQGYGLSETSPVVSSTTRVMKLDKNIKTDGSSGRPVPNTLVKIISTDSDSGEALRANESGELLVKGPQVMQGYFNRPEETENSFLDGWFRTGDIAYYNDDGCIFVKDRLKELIKVKGFQVPPAELEGIIREFPNISEAAVIGIPHPTDGEIPRAYIITKENINLNELEAYVNKKVAPYKRLKGGIKIVDSIPKNASGKILRRELKLQYQNENK